MGATNHYKGDRIRAGTILQVGDFLMSPNGRFVAVLEQNGSFSIYWNSLDQVSVKPDSFVGRPESLIWSSPGDNPGPHFLCQQTDGNLVVYRGTSFQDCGGSTWATDTSLPGGGNFVSVLHDDSSLRVMSGGEKKWDSQNRVEGDTFHTCAPMISQGSTRFTLSSIPATGTIGRPSIQVVGEAPTDDQLWLVLQWSYVDRGNYMNHKRIHVGTVFINKQTGLALGSDGVGTTMMTAIVDDNAAWDRGSAENGSAPPSAQTAIRLKRDERLNLNVKGDAPYVAGTEVLLWNWTGPVDNSVWVLKARDLQPAMT